MKTYTLEEAKDRLLGTVGTPNRDIYEMELQFELLGDMIRKTRKEQNLTQEELGKLVGVQKSRIARLEKNTKNVTVETIIKVFKALKADVKLKVNFAGQEMAIY